jgi:tetratricopeptide (TPR) repeat protein
MKAEHRKELQTNALADRLGKWLQELRAGPTTNALIFWGFLILAVGIVVGLVWYANSANSARSALWVSLDSANSITDLDKLIKDHPGTTPARIAEFEKARALMREGLEYLLAISDKQREEAVDKIKEAGELYEKLANEMTDNPPLTQEALFGAGKAQESLGEIDKAIEFYKDKLAAKYPDSPLGKEAAKQAESLEKNRETAKEFYDELKKLIAAEPK